MFTESLITCDKNSLELLINVYAKKLKLDYRVPNAFPLRGKVKK